MAKPKGTHTLTVKSDAEMLLIAASRGRLVRWWLNSRGEIVGVWLSRDGKRALSACKPWWGNKVEVFRGMMPYDGFVSGMETSLAHFEAKINARRVEDCLAQLDNYN